jgi:hypothetical protein
MFNRNRKEEEREKGGPAAVPFLLPTPQNPHPDVIFILLEKTWSTDRLLQIPIPKLYVHTREIGRAFISPFSFFNEFLSCFV